MKEMKTLEARLRSWKPRRPSPGIERRLFGEAASFVDLHALMRVLVPAAACVILTIGIMSHREPDDAVAMGQGAILAMSLSNQSYASYLPGSFECDANRLDTFRWTNRGGLPSSTFSNSPGKANN